MSSPSCGVLLMFSGLAMEQRRPDRQGVRVLPVAGGEASARTVCALPAGAEVSDHGLAGDPGTRAARTDRPAAATRS